jgi:uncharacterized protein YcbX
VTTPGIPQLAAICRHPIKSAGYELVSAADLVAGSALPGDRQWAIAHADAKVAGPVAGWVPKSQFLRGVVAPDLMAIRAETLGDGRSVTLHHPRATSITIAPDDAADQARLIDWLAPFWPADKAPPARVVRAESAMTDKPQPYVSVLNLASLHELSQRISHDLSIHRFRGNLWIDGASPWAEFDLVGREISIGATRLLVCERITRCTATTANPETGVFDADTLSALQSGYGHRDFGVFAKVVAGGRIETGMSVAI